MARKSKQERFIESAIDTAFISHGSNVQFSVMDLGKITNDVRSAVERDIENWASIGQSVSDHLIQDTINTAMQAAVAKYRQN